MTQTQLWLEKNGASVARQLRVAGVLSTVGLVMAVLGIGIVVGRLGTYRLLPQTVVFGWFAAVAVVFLGFSWVRRLLRQATPRSLARQVELRRGLRHGSIGGMVEWSEQAGSIDLARLADRQSVGVVG